MQILLQKSNLENQISQVKNTLKQDLLKWERKEYNDVLLAYQLELNEVNKSIETYNKYFN